jgi:CPA2 family monovalent cation:H+ antiporter-2
MHEVHLVGELAIVLGVAAVTTLLARWARQPAILGHLIAGIIVGPYVPIPIFADAKQVNELAELGVVLVMFAIGLEFRIAKLVRVLPTSGVTGLVQVSFMWWCGLSLGQAIGLSDTESVFLGAAIAISSTMVVSKVFGESEVADDVRRHVLGVLVIQDVLAIVLIAAMTAVAAGGGLAPRELAAMLGRLAAVLALMLAGGLIVIPRAIRGVLKLKSADITVVFAVGLCFVFALLAQLLGYSVALGAFLAGILVAESGRGSDVEHLIQPMRDVFAAIFFVSIGMTVDPRGVVEQLPYSLLVFVVVILGQLVSVSVMGIVSGLGLRRAIMAALALGQVGEFAFILASIGIVAGVVRPELQTILVTVAVLTTFTTPLAIRHGERLVHLVDIALPRRLRRLLSLYESWFARVARINGEEPSAASGEAEGRSAVRRALRAVALDAVGLIVILAVAVTTAPRLSQWIAARFGLGTSVASAVVFLAIMLAGLPLVSGLLRNTAALARQAGAAVAVAGGEGRQPAARATRVLIYLLVTLAVGAPVVAVLRPLVPGYWAPAAFALLVTGISIYVWRSAAEVDQEFRSGAEQLADTLARAAANEGGESQLRDASLLPGLDRVVGLRIAPASHAVGKSLATLDLRARTGTTVIAIHREGGQVVLPTGREHIESGDRLALAGTPDAVERARAILLTGAPEEKPSA